VRIAAWQCLTELCTAAINQLISGANVHTDTPQHFSAPLELANEIVRMSIEAMRNVYDAPRVRYGIGKAWNRCVSGVVLPAEPYILPYPGPTIHLPPIATSVGGKLSSAFLNSEPIQHLRKELWQLLKCVNSSFFIG